MNNLIDRVAAQQKATLPEEYLSGQDLFFEIPTEGDLAGLRFVKGRYLDGSIIYDNMKFIIESEEDEDKFPAKCKIDASAALLAWIVSKDENGLSMLSSSQFRENLSELMMQAYAKEGTVFDMITCDCEDEENTTWE